MTTPTTALSICGDGSLELRKVLAAPCVEVLLQYGADIDATSSKKDWTPLSYAKAMGKYGLTSEKGIYPEDVLKYYGATKYGKGPDCLGVRSPRESFDPSKDTFSRDRGSYQREPEHP